ncbi:ABC transporter permease [Dyadobacter sp. LJ53]|uniref:ABC transporter permease n=1 Tax=Dyadobacter chenwenxiniae TaxID=2906456 RepID=UPI001F3B6B2A|nr:ABC transporter permease [Dyadobacter chenwenxiniae]MCF0053608.1 ABC transporter permease [Dyadobacter chenwenxiniae]
MLAKYFLIGLRNFRRNKLYIIINILGLGIAIACCIAGYFNWKFKENWDSNHKNAANIFRVEFMAESQGNVERYGVSPMPLGEQLKISEAGAASIVRYFPSNTTVRIGSELFNTDMAYADSAFFDMFSFELIDGSFSNFKDKSKIFISRDLAQKYFNSVHVIGKKVTQISNNQKKIFTVGGVFEQQPLNSSFSFSAITLFPNVSDFSNGLNISTTDWGAWNTTFLKINNPKQVSVIQRQLQQYVQPQNWSQNNIKVKDYYLENFKGMAQRSMQEPIVKWQQLRYGIPQQAIIVPNVTAFLLLLLACFNFTNTSIAISSRRFKEIGVRKVMGANKSQLIFQFMGENLLLCFFALIAGLIFAEFLIPAYNSLWPFLKLSLNYAGNLEFMFFLTGLLIVTALIAGSYPAIYITNFAPVSILKNKIRLGSTNWFTRILLGLTFTISLLAIIFAMAFYNNARYQKDFDLGYATTGITSVHLKEAKDFQIFKNIAETNPEIQLVAGTKDHITQSITNHSVSYESIKKQVDVMDVGENYCEALKIEIVSGRGFQQGSETDFKESVLVTEEFVKRFGWKDNVIGKRITINDSIRYNIVGVLKNIYTHSLYEPVSPVLLKYARPEQYREIIVTAELKNAEKVNTFLKSEWKKNFPDKIYDSQSIEVVKESSNRVNNNGVKIVGCLGFIAILMSVTGLYTLVSLNIIKKTQEVGIRKVLGASEFDIARIINLEFFLILACAAFFGSFIGYRLVDNVLGSLWKHYWSMEFGTVALCVLTMIAIASFILVYKTLKVSSLNPVKTLRSE